MILDLRLAGGAVALVVVLSVSIMAIGAQLSASGQMEKYWHKQDKYERWMVGAPLPPCGSAFVYWSPNCGSLWGNTKKLCPMGQPFHKRACKLWWSHGSRPCNLVGCQPLCFDLSRSRCDVGKNFTLSYDANGLSMFTKP